jgi:tight adherence protein C
MTDIGLRLIGAIFAAVFIIMALRMVIRPPARLSNRVRPYSAAGRSALGNNPDNAMLSGRETIQAQGVLERLYRPIVESLLKSLTKTFGGAFDDETLALKLRQSGVLSEVPEEERVHEFRVRQIASGLGFGLFGGLCATVLGSSPPLILAIVLVAAIGGVARMSAGISGRIEDRRERMRIELYTINQLMAIYLRTSGSPILAAQRLVRRGRGEVIDELNEALRLHARGMSATKAFGRLAETTPEPFAARTYKLLSTGSERGADLASALLALSEDVRDARRTDVRRNATKRQGAMLLPIICCLAPVMLLFIAAPLPSMITGG